MIWYILVCSLIGGISVSCTQGLGACILTSIRGQDQVISIYSNILHETAHVCPKVQELVHLFSARICYVHIM